MGPSWLHCAAGLGAGDPDNRGMKNFVPALRSPSALLLLVAALCGACAPALNWREVRPPEQALSLMFPCKPEFAQRPVTPAAPVAMGMAQCEAQGQQFSLSWAELGDPGLVQPALQQMREALLAKLGGQAGVPRPVQIAGMTPGPQALQQQVLPSAGEVTGGKSQARRVDLALFSRGTRVYQLMVIGPQREASVWDFFIGSVKLAS